MVKYHIVTHDIKGSIYDGTKDIDLPEGEIPIGFSTIVLDPVTGTQHIDWRFQLVMGCVRREWTDKEHTEYVCVIDGKLKRYQVVTRVYCMAPKS